MSKKLIAIIFVLLVLTSSVTVAGPLCQTACNIGWVKCYAALGFIAGTVTGGTGAPLVVHACNIAQGAFVDYSTTELDT
ncbi:6810_t:CDS:2 [Dentiscutata heterogama]|uniref:6810_t:CDS:1 n=1 Tax=Dentiscutata heterogama TaxID=1316150 RepID=A0ACA9MT66_9GLOM|nr:6810_t:CDS:2 [Dentiscutata heterogama]